MSSIYYSAAWTECGCLISCWHHHQTVGEAVLCIRGAGGYVVAVETGVMRCLTAEEEAEFRCVVHPPCANSPVVQTTLAAAAGQTIRDPGYAVMTRIRVVDHWTWATWMCFETYAQAVAHARKGDKVVRFSSEEWVALRQQKWAALPQQTEAASPILMNAVRESLPARGEGETFVEFVPRLLKSCNNTYPVARCMVA